MISVGFDPKLECSSKNPKGDKRFSAFYARIKARDNKSIEELYQASKVFQDGTTNLSIKEAKGKQAINMLEVHKFYSQLWDEYFNENPELLKVIAQFKGFSDIFGQPNHCCQAVEIYRIWIQYQLRNLNTNMIKYKHLVLSNRMDFFSIPFNAVPCYRGTEFGNPYTHLKSSNCKHPVIEVSSVEEAIAHHRYDFVLAWNTIPSFKEKVLALKGKPLVCYCSTPTNPKPCHCFTIAAAANS